MTIWREHALGALRVWCRVAAIVLLAALGQWIWFGVLMLGSSPHPTEARGLALVLEHHVHQSEAERAGVLAYSL